MERRLAAILAADVAGYSRLTERDEEASTSTVRAYCAAAEEIICEHYGHVFTRAGDGIVAEFPSVVEAVRCAVEIRNEIDSRNVALPEDARMHFRIGVNLGDVIRAENDVYGTGVNVAVRLEQFAKPGGICVSQTVHDQVRKIVDFPFEDLGLHRFKNINEAVHVYRILPSPMPWVRRVLSRRNFRRYIGPIAGVAVLFLAVTSGAYFIRESPATWNTLLHGIMKPPLTEEASLAVLPFEDHSPGSNKGWLADGIAEELITGLAKFPELSVVARTSTFAYKDRPTDIRKIGGQLNVRYVLEGSIQSSGDNVRVTAQLIDAQTGNHIWAEKYDRKVDNIFDVRDEITRAIAGTLGGLQGKIAKAEITRLLTEAPNTTTARAKAWRGWYEFYKFTCDDNEKARQFFLEAISKDITYPRAYAGLAWTYASDYDFECNEEFDKNLKNALEAARTAVGLDEDDYQAHWALGWAYLYSHEYEKAKTHYLRARELNPKDAEVLAEMANYLIYSGQPKKAIDQLKEAIRLNPFHENWYIEFLGWAYEEAGMPEAIETFEKAIDLGDIYEYLLVPSNEDERKGVSSLEIRKSPRWSDEPFAVALEDTKLRVLGRDGNDSNWVRVSDPGTGQEGWIYTEQESRINGEEKLWALPSWAAAYAAVGKVDEARKVREKLLEFQPDFSISENVSLLPYQTKQLADRYVNALRRAGLPD